MKAKLMVIVVGSVAPVCLADGIFGQDSYPETFSFDGAPANLSQTSMNITFDGSRYQSASGGGPDGLRLAEWDPAGNLSATYEPGLDFRSVFTVGGNGATVYGRQYSDNTIYEMTGPGVFSPGVVLEGSMDAQSQVEFNSAGDEFIALSAGGLLSRWNLKGVALKSINFDGWGDRFEEGNYPQDRGVVSAAGYYLTYSNGNLSAWDAGGVRVGTTVLKGAGTSFDSHFSLSWANGMVWVIDIANGTWRAYAIPELTGDDCYADCDGDSSLTIDDFICYQTLFALSDPSADCDGDSSLTIDDFICFQTFFAIGC